MLNLDINGRRVSVRPGTKLLAAIREAGVSVPTLCHHEALDAYAACRLCVVEIRRPGSSRGRIVASCVYQAEAGLQVETETDAVKATRREVLDLLLARCPTSPVIQQLAAEHGVVRSSYPPDQNRDQCILCGLCTRVCAKLGYTAISMSGRGAEREVAPPLHEPPPDCTGCASCSRICPTGNIPMVERAGLRRIWEQDFEMQRCQQCGRAWITKKHLQARLAATGLPETHFDHCDECHRAKLAQTMFSRMVPAEKGATP
jgi:bidirectional [NiFe] hydrogenase diaphorase subunit